MWDFGKNVQQYYSVLTPAAAYPVTLAEAKAYLRVTNTAEDTLINSLIIACTNMVENYTGRTLINTTFRGQFSTLTVLKTESWPVIELMRGPVVSISAVEELVDGSWTDLDADDWALKEMDGYSRILVDPSVTSVADSETIVPYQYRVDFIAGYGAPAGVPDDLKTAIKLAINFFFTNRGDCGECGMGMDAGTLPPESKMMANPYRIRRIF